MIKARRLMVAGIAALALATGLGSAALAAQPAPAATSAMSRMPACSPAHLAIWVNQHGMKKRNVFYYRLEFTNLTGHSCWMRGFPGVLAEGLHGKRLGDPAVKIGGTPKVRTVLPAHGTAHSLLGYRFTDIPLASCKAEWSSYLRVQEPQGWGVKTFFTKQVCSVRNGIKDLQVSPIQPGL